ncbi:hypothetical protein [Sphingobium aquiterrae]|uniref:lipopolysaccharide biosynthesis protein n=1 Tax=Sphingobium aquiterrae TaxID=2038656 RepID=UPI00301603A5
MSPAGISIALYALAIGLASGANFLTAPLLLALQGPVGLARWGLVEPLILALIPIAGFGINFGIMHLLTGSDAPRRIIGRVWRYQIAAVSVTALVGAALAWHWFGGAIALLAAGIIAVEGAITLFISYWRACNQPIRFAAIEGGRAALVVLLLAIALLLPRNLVPDVQAYMALRLGVGALAIAAGFALIRPIGGGDRVALRTAVHFGLPIVIASMLVALATSIDRYILASAGASALMIGAYVAHVKLIQILGSALAPFFTWFAPVAMRRLQDGKAAHGFFVNSAFLFYAVNAALTLMLWFAAPLLWEILFKKLDFDPTLFALLLIGQAIFSLGNPVSIGTLRPGRTWLALMSTAGMLIVTLVACFLFGRVWGAPGIAFGRLLGMVSYTLFLGGVTVHDLKIRFGWWRFVVITALIGSVMAATSPMLSPSPLNSAAMALAALCLLSGLVWAIRPRGGTNA